MEAEPEEGEGEGGNDGGPRFCGSEVGGASPTANPGFEGSVAFQPERFKVNPVAERGAKANHRITFPRPFDEVGIRERVCEAKGANGDAFRFGVIDLKSRGVFEPAQVGPKQG